MSELQLNFAEMLLRFSELLLIFGGSSAEIHQAVAAKNSLITAAIQPPFRAIADVHQVLR